MRESTEWRVSWRRFDRPKERQYTIKRSQAAAVELYDRLADQNYPELRLERRKVQMWSWHLLREIDKVDVGDSEWYNDDDETGITGVPV